jgi:hypothetical protein
MNTPNQFLKTQNLLNIAIDKVKARLDYYSTERAKMPEMWTDEHERMFWDWNLLHDLQYRLECRLHDNYSKYQEWHFNTYGWAAY